MSHEESSAPVPILQALILADEVYVDASSGKKVIAGTFNQLWSTKFPNTFGRSTKAYLNLTDCHGELNLQLHYVDLKDDSVLIESPVLAIRSEDPLTNHELILDVPPFPMPHEGAYVMELYCNGVRLGGLRLTVSRMEPQQDNSQ